MKKIPVPVGERFGRLTVVADGNVGKWTVKCDCGTIKQTHSGNVRKGATVSCGCQRAESMSDLASTHGMSSHPLYVVWKSMRQRVQRDPDYIGVTVCGRWDHFPNFVEDMGEQPEGMTLDRIDSNGNYEPGNCRWATKKEQSVNRRNVRMITHAGKTLCLADWAREVGISRKGLVKRIDAGWPVDRVLTPARVWTRHGHA